MQAFKGSKLAWAGVELRTIKEALVSAASSATPGRRDEGADEGLMHLFPGV
jgi:hypothetical protein